MWTRLMLLVCVVVTAFACDADAKRLAVSVRTDFRPGAEFDAIHIEFDDGLTLDHTARTNADYLEGVRLAEEPAQLGETGIVVQLMRGGSVVIERHVSVTVQASLTIATVVITRDCTGVMCPGTGSPLFESCLGGQCADPRCTRETPEFCPVAECVNDDECPAAVDCAARRCIEGVCFAALDDARCDDNFECDRSRGCVSVGQGMDAGVDAAPDAGSDGGSSCLDGLQNGAEDGVDCGGSCPACNACPTMPNALYCSDFSDDSLADWGLTRIEGSAQLEVTTVGAFDGASLFVSAEPGDVAYVERILPAVAAGPLYARFYLYVEPGERDAERPVFELASASSVLRMVVRPDDGFYIYANEQGNGGGPSGRPGAWQCIRYEVQIGEAGEHAFGVDNGRAAFPPLDTRPGASGYNRVRLGMLAAEGSVAATMRIDSFAIGTAPIPCL